MNQVNNNIAHSHISVSHESVDLIDILLQLKRGKWIIIAFVILTTILATIYLSVAKEKWTSEAIITYPDSGQIANYNNAMNVLYSQNPTNAPNVVDLQQRFFGRFNAAISALSDQLDNQAVSEKLTITPSVKDQPVPLKISFTAATAGEAQKTLTTYIQQINKRVLNELDDDLQISIDAKIRDLKEELISKEVVAKEKNDTRLQAINQALIVAQQSNIKNTVVQQADTLSDDTLFVLGSNALSSMIKNEATRPLPLDRAYYSARQALLAISALKSKSDSTYSIRYVMKPNLPLRRDSPKKPLILILGALIGIILGAVVVLGRNAVRNYSLHS